MDITHSSSCRCTADGVSLEITTTYDSKGTSATSEYRLATHDGVLYLSSREYSALTRIIGAIAEVGVAGGAK